MNKWVKKLDEGKINRTLTRAECLAVSLFLKNENWFGETCFDRSLENMKEGTYHCFEEEWSNKFQVYYDCGLNGLGFDGGTNWRSPYSEMNIFESHSECEWDPSTIHLDLTEEVIKSAFKFMAFPE